jgi:hypothetical protein
MLNYVDGKILNQLMFAIYVELWIEDEYDQELFVNLILRLLRNQLYVYVIIHKLKNVLIEFEEDDNELMWN